MRFPLFAPRRAEAAVGPAAGGGAPDDATSLPSAPPPAEPRRAHGYAREAAALVLLASALYSALALTSFRADPARPEIMGADWVGPVGATAARATVEAVGLAAWFVPIELVLLATPLLNGKKSGAGVARFGGDVVVLAVLAALGHVAFPKAVAFGAMPLGGQVGELFGEVMRALFSQVGSYIIGSTVVALILIGRATFSFIEWVARVRAFFERLGTRGAGGFRALAGAWTEARAIERGEDDERGEGPVIARPSNADAIIAALSDDDVPASAGRRAAWSSASPEDASPLVGAAPASAARVVGAVAARAASPVVVAPSGRSSAPPIVLAADEPDLVVPPAEQETPDPPAGGRAARAGAKGRRGRAKAEAPPPSEPTPPSPSIELRAEFAEVAADLRVPTPSPIPPVSEPPRRAAKEAVREALVEPAREAPKERAPREEPKGPMLVDTSAAMEAEKATVVIRTTPGFHMPSPDMLDAASVDKQSLSEADLLVREEKLKQMATLLEKTLADYGVSGKVEEIHPGPTVTTFEVSPAAGTKVSKVASLADDLALGLSRKVRIIAPIPGKNRIGFEIPNEQRVPVNLRELIEDRRFVEMKAPLPCVLGRDIIGAPYFADLSSMPHVIVAGATGAGKSVGLNVVLMSLLFRKTPEELRLLMIDPKVVELAPFDRIPHMLLPVVTDMKQAANALKWAVDEMERRYQLFANAGTKNITTYNHWVERIRAGEIKLPKRCIPQKVAAIAADGTEVEVDQAQDGTDVELPEKIPFIVIVVDEFADLMMQQGKDVEAAVARLAQKARAAGMHVILATQRPSVDVITGMIKANFPTRVAFRVAQKVDSRTILDEQGAEHLLGRGDMLVKMNGQNDTRRVQCPFVTEEEVQRVTDFLRLQGEPVYDEAILKPRDEEGGEDAEEAEADPLYDQAVRIVADTRRCSTSWLQRKLGIGYNRAAKIVETMEKRGIVGPANGAKEREVLLGSI
jgi:S-DNA-T family DNA segregation ATPase FtsK/SpoIIIE